MAEIDDIRAEIARAAEAGDEATVTRLSTRYRDLQARDGALPPVGRFRAETGREYQLARRSLDLRRAGREDDAKRLIRTISNERSARRITRNGGGRLEAALFGANRGLLNLGTLATGAREFIEDTLGGNSNGLTAREVMEDYSAVQDAVRRRHPVSAGAGEAGGVVLSLATPGGGGARAVQGASRTGRVARAAATGAGYGAAQGASDALVRNEDVGEGAAEGAGIGAVAGGGLSALGQVLAPVLRAAGNRLADQQGLRLLAEHVTPDQLSRLVLAARQYVRERGRQPTLVEIAGMADPTLAREAGQIVESRVPASLVAQQGANRIRVQAQRDVAEAVLPRTSTSSRVATDETTRAMQAISGSAAVARRGTPLHNFLTSPDVSASIQSLPPSLRAAFDDAIGNNGTVTVRMLDDLRQEMGNLAKNSGADRVWNEVANTARDFADQITGNAYSRVLRQHGQNAFREEIANQALRSPAAAQRVAGDLAESAKVARDMSAELGPAEAARIRNSGSIAQRALRGVDEFEPRTALSRGEEAGRNIDEAARAALLSKTGGAGTSAFIARNLRRLGISPQQAEQFARDFVDPSQTQRAIRFLQDRIGQGPTNNFVATLERAGVRPTVERVAAVGSRLAARDGAPPQPEIPATEPPQPSLEQDAAPQEQVQAQPSSYVQDVEARAQQAFDAGDEAAGEQMQELAARLHEVEALLANALASGDTASAEALREQYFRILNNEN